MLLLYISLEIVQRSVFVSKVQRFRTLFRIDMSLDCVYHSFTKDLHSYVCCDYSLGEKDSRDTEYCLIDLSFND